MAAKKKTRKKVAKKAAKKTATKRKSTKPASPAQKAVRARFAAAARKGGIKKGAKLGTSGKRKAATKKVAKRRRAAPVQYGPHISEEQLDMAMTRHKRRQKRQYDKEYPKDVTYGPKGPPRKRKKAAKKASRRSTGDRNITLADIKKGVNKTATAPKKGARRQARKATVAYVCAGPTRSGCGGGKKGSHVIGRLW